MAPITILAYTSATYAVVLALVVLFGEARKTTNLAYCAGMLALGAEGIFNAWSFSAQNANEAIRWGYCSHMMASFLPGLWLSFSLSYARGNDREFLTRWRWVIAAAFLIPLSLAIGWSQGVITGANQVRQQGHWFLDIGPSGFYLKILTMVGFVLVLMNLESTLRTSVGVMRWRIKFMIIGMGLLLLLRIYTGSHKLLQTGVDDLRVGMDAGALLAACLLMTVSLVRRSLGGIDVYPSQTFLLNSLVVFITGVYLLVVGVFAKLLDWMGGEKWLPLKPFLILIGVVGLGVLFLSERIRQRFKRLISRHFQRPFYDYRKVWMTFTDTTATLMQESDFCRAAVRWISDTFQLLSVTVWIYDLHKSRLVYAASTSLTEAKSQELLTADFPWEGLIAALKNHSQPVDIEDSQEPWGLALKQLNPSVFPGQGGNRVCVPLIAREELVGAVLLGDRVSGMPFSFEDMDLLKCIGDQMAGDLLNIHLSREIVQAKEMEAFQTMSAFFVHDLKNTASTLSLMLQNMQIHFDDPEFREDARRAVSKSVDHIKELINRLSVLRQGLVMKKVPAALHRVVDAALANLGSMDKVTLTKDLAPVPLAQLDPEQIQKVVANLVLNARDAVANEGEIHVSTSATDGWAQLSVTDNGCGMSKEFLEKSLYRPFQTMKKKGIGIGMYHSKMIVEAHRGKIEARSQLGKGTTFLVLLPLAGGE